MYFSRRHVSVGIQSNWLNAREVKRTPLQLDIHHALWGLYHGADRRFCPPGVPTRGQRGTASRAKDRDALLIETKVRKKFSDLRGRRKEFISELRDFFSDLHWRSKCLGGNWEELHRQKLHRRKQLATTSA